jgi:hypothetical protein
MNADNDRNDRALTRSFWERHASLTIVVALVVLMGLIILIGP